MSDYCGCAPGRIEGRGGKPGQRRRLDGQQVETTPQDQQQRPRTFEKQADHEECLSCGVPRSTEFYNGKRELCGVDATSALLFSREVV